MCGRVGEGEAEGRKASGEAVRGIWAEMLRLPTPRLWFSVSSLAFGERRQDKPSQSLQPLEGGILGGTQV